MSGARADAGQRLRRLLAILAYLAQHQRVPVVEVAERFGLSADELVADLELAACCGVPPYTPDQLMEIIIEGDEVHTRLGPELARPRRLSSEEGFSLAVAARALAAVPGVDDNGALARGLAKLDLALDARRLTVALDSPPLLEELRQAVESHSQLRIEYHSASSDEVSNRLVDPMALVSSGGRWYLDAWCHKAEAVRRFRADRVLSCEKTGERVVPRESAQGHTATKAMFGPDLPVATIEVDSDMAWVVDSVPALAIHPNDDGSLRIELAVADVGWLGRLMLQLGRSGRVVYPPELVEVAKAVAERILARYD